MWYNKKTNTYIKSHTELWDLLFSIGLEIYNNNDAVDEIIDDMYGSVNLFNQFFLPSEIVKKLAPVLYKELSREMAINWADDILYTIERTELKEGDILADISLIDYDELGQIEWRDN